MTLGYSGTVTEQTRNDGFHMNYSACNEWRVSDRDHMWITGNASVLKYKYLFNNRKMKATTYKYKRICLMASHIFLCFIVCLLL